MEHGKEPLQIGSEEIFSQARKPYLKPTFRSERIFETMALTCGKINSTQQQCKTNKKNS